jgi:hypothetical protein
MIKKKKQLLINGAVILALSAIALWDAVKIINDYIFDNRLTLINAKTVV